MAAAVSKSVWAGVVLALVGVASPVAAAPVGLEGGPLAGTVGAGVIVDLTIGFDPNEVAAPTLVSHLLSVGLYGLRVTDAALGSLYAGFTEAELLDTSGEFDCTAADAPCTPEIALDGYTREWLSSAVLFAPAATAGPGTVFSLRLQSLSGATDWRLNVFGEGSSLLWEPPDQCTTLDPECAAQQEEVPFAIVVDSDTSTPGGTARITVTASVTPVSVPVAVPEGGVTGAWALSLGVLAWLRSRRRS